MASHHPDHALLLDYAAGSMNHSLSLIVATHLAMCPACRKDVAELEAIGGVLLEADAGTIAPSDEAFDAVMERIEAEQDDVTFAVASSASPREIAHLPRPLSDCIPVEDGRIRWGRQGAIDTIFLPSEDPGHRVRLLRIAPGKGAPQHSHRGLELTLVLQGSFHDETGRYAAGDLEMADPDLDHRPIADEGEPCICLAVTTAPLRLTGPLGRLIDPFLTI
jgi:putative transcriptional regulator